MKDELHSKLWQAQQLWLARPSPPPAAGLPFAVKITDSSRPARAGLAGG